MKQMNNRQKFVVAAKQNIQKNLLGTNKLYRGTTRLKGKLRKQEEKIQKLK